METTRITNILRRLLRVLKVTAIMAVQESSDRMDVDQDPAVRPEVVFGESKPDEGEPCTGMGLDTIWLHFIHITNGVYHLLSCCIFVGPSTIPLPPPAAHNPSSIIYTPISVCPIRQGDTVVVMGP
ncbi:hypothetical protein P691DRAFT_115997 [Macrolepiota fuliginosa MF-IS2]|uniref:Uncharacterized protein n=1 Tax=Macrolepiota fuliginosa MF-IS2 TaxID=1400762 RepID=A0A9P5WWZ7_9AGAR|nr:hypothetical protein P691DRAFT_115997 [Macrolepiota fuliginosa MF-IS2]